MVGPRLYSSHVTLVQTDMPDVLLLVLLSHICMARIKLLSSLRSTAACCSAVPLA